MNLNRLTVGELPSEMIAVQREGRRYRRGLEVSVVEKKGEISVTDAHHIDTAAAATIQAGICRWLLRHRVNDMSTADIRGSTADIVKAKERRDAAVKALNLNAPPPDMWAVIDAPKVGEAE